MQSLERNLQDNPIPAFHAYNQNLVARCALKFGSLFKTVILFITFSNPIHSYTLALNLPEPQNTETNILVPTRTQVLQKR